MAAGRAVFLDRDGTIIVDVGFISDPADIELVPACTEGLAALSKAGFKLVVVSNQSGIGRGLITEDQARQVDQECVTRLAGLGIHLDGTYYCPHTPEEGCSCRKPLPGMLLLAAEQLDLDLATSWMIGDRVSDIEAGRLAGCRTALLGDVDVAPEVPTTRAADWPGLARSILDREATRCEVAE